MGASPVALWVCDFHTKGLCSPENSTCVPGSFDLAARRRGRQVGKAGGDVCVGEGTRAGMRLQHGHGTSPGQQFLGSYGCAQHSSAPLALLPPPTSSPSSAAAHPQTSLFALQKYMEEVGSEAASKWPGAVMATRAERTHAGCPTQGSRLQSHSHSNPASGANRLQPCCPSISRALQSQALEAPLTLSSTTRHLSTRQLSCLNREGWKLIRAPSLASRGLGV